MVRTASRIFLIGTEGDDAKYPASAERIFCLAVTAAMTPSAAGTATTSFFLVVKRFDGVLDGGAKSSGTLPILGGLLNLDLIALY